MAPETCAVHHVLVFEMPSKCKVKANIMKSISKTVLLYLSGHRSDKKSRGKCCRAATEGHGFYWKQCVYIYI